MEPDGCTIDYYEFSDHIIVSKIVCKYLDMNKYESEDVAFSLKQDAARGLYSFS